MFTDPDEQYRVLKEITLTALVSDDRLMETFVLKGGNALYLIYGMSSRASLDLDFSMQGAFKDEEWRQLIPHIEQLLIDRFGEANLSVFDFSAEEKPPNVSEDLKHFWGGYRIEFKVIQKSVRDSGLKDRALAAKRALTIGPGQQRTIRVDISKHESCDDKVDHIIRGYTVYVYTPRLIVAEKLRAICQQMPDYNHIVRRSNRSGRARDFFDIFTICEKYSIAPTKDIAKLSKRVFDAKRVRWDALAEIRKHQQLYEADYTSLVETLSSFVRPEPFEAYFRFVAGFAHSLHSLGDV